MTVQLQRATDKPMQLTDELLREIATEASASTVSVMRRLLGLRVRGLTGARVDAALAARTPEPTKRKAKR